MKKINSSIVKITSCEDIEEIHIVCRLESGERFVPIIIGKENWKLALLINQFLNSKEFKEKQEEVRK